MQTLNKRPVPQECGVLPEGLPAEAPTTPTRKGLQAVLYFAQRAASILPTEAPAFMSEHGGNAIKRNELGVVAFANTIPAPVTPEQAATVILSPDSKVV